MLLDARSPRTWWADDSRLWEASRKLPMVRSRCSERWRLGKQTAAGSPRNPGGPLMSHSNSQSSVPRSGIMDLLTALPDSLLYQIATSLTFQECATLQQCCKHLRRVLDTERCWLDRVENTPNMPSCPWGVMAPRHLLAALPILRTAGGPASHGPCQPSAARRLTGSLPESRRHSRP